MPMTISTHHRRSASNSAERGDRIVVPISILQAGSPALFPAIESATPDDNSALHPLSMRDGRESHVGFQDEGQLHGTRRPDKSA